MKLCVIGCQFILVAALPATSAELELIDLDTFISPNYLVSGRADTTNRGSYQFLSSSLYAGVESHYQFRNDFADAQSAVFRSANNYYIAPFQVGLDLTGRQSFDGQSAAERDRVPSFKAKFEFSWYYPILRSAAKTNTVAKPSAARRMTNVVESFWTRLQAGWSIEDQSHGEWVNELALELEVAIVPIPDIQKLPFMRSFTGGYLYAWQPETEKQFLAYGGRYELYRWRNGSNIKWGIWISGEGIDGAWHWAAFRNELSVEIAHLTRFASLNMGYAATRDLNDGQWHHQGLIFINVPIRQWLWTKKGM